MVGNLTICISLILQISYHKNMLYFSILHYLIICIFLYERGFRFLNDGRPAEIWMAGTNLPV
jgi:hypothetical protein